MTGEREIGIGEIGRVDRAERIDPADPAQIEIVALRDDLDVSLRLPERWHAAILKNPAGPGVIGGEREDDIAVERVELGR